VLDESELSLFATSGVYGGNMYAAQEQLQFRSRHHAFCVGDSSNFLHYRTRLNNCTKASALTTKSYVRRAEHEDGLHSEFCTRTTSFSNAESIGTLPIIQDRRLCR